MKKIIKKVILSLSCVLIFVTSVILIFISINTDNGTAFKPSNKNFAQSNFEIEPNSYQTNSDNYKMFSNYYTLSGSTVTATGAFTIENIILLSTEQDLYAFSYLANNNDAYLTYHYMLNNNITYTALTYEFLPISYKNNSGFTGTFDGNGYEISNLRLSKIINDATAKEFGNMSYYGMFSNIGSSGKVINLGLINTDIAINVGTSIQGIAVLAGQNNGTIEYCYVKDLRDIEIDEAGLNVSGGYQISGFVFINKGIMSNCYSAYSIVEKYTVTDYISFTEILDTNDGGTCNNLFYYNSTLVDYTLTGGSATKVYHQGYIGKTYVIAETATYADSIETLNTNCLSTGSNWYNSTKYSDTIIKEAISKMYSTPILRGIEFVDEAFRITNAKDFIYMFELIKKNSYFSSSSVKYLIVNDIDLKNVYSSEYSLNSYFSATLEGNKTTSSLIDVLGNNYTYPTIYNYRIDNTIISEGIECYGLFPLLSGTINNLNFYINDDVTNFSSASANSKAIGLVAGYADNAKFNNVNVYGDLTLTTSSNTSIGKYYAGGICGLSAALTTFNNVTTAGSIVGGTNIATFTDVTNQNFVTGTAIGGICGYSMPSSSNFNNCVNTISITGISYNQNTSITQHIGGVLGAGYTSNFVNISNKAIISTLSNAGSFYLAGVIGRHLGMTEKVQSVINTGDIIAYGNSNNCYVSGVEIVELVSSSTTLTNSTLKNTKGKLAYFGSSISNAANITFNGGQSSNIKAAGVLYLNSNTTTSKFVSDTCYVYNLSNRDLIVDKTFKTNQKVNADEIDMSSVASYSACIYTSGSNADTSTNTRVTYNLKDINFVTKSTINKDLLYSGCIGGKYVDAYEAYNEGNIKYTLTYGIGSSSKTISFISTGVLEEVSPGYKASNVYNGGNISLDGNVVVYANLYFSGICYKNLNGFSDTELASFNPLSSSFDSKKEGSLDNAINNGKITVSNAQYNNIDFTYNAKKSANNQQLIGVTYGYTGIPTGRINGNVYLAGVTFQNESVITNSFNLGDIFNADYADGSYNLLSAGISVYNVSKFAYILNSANNGVIKTMNLSTNINAKVYSSGITCRNDLTSTGSVYTGGASHANQMISFTINYGSIYSYNYANNITSSADEPRTNSSGILSLGLCNIINVVNYGNIYSSETTSGIFGVVYFSRFTSDVNTNNKVNISNSINYGNIYVLDKGDNLFYDASSYRVKYDAYVNFNDNNINEAIALSTITVPTGMNNTNVTTSSVTPKPIYARTYIERTENPNYFIGSIFSLINFNNLDNANNVNVRNLISFNEKVKIVANEAGTPSSVTTDVNTIYSSYYELTNGVESYSTYMGKNTVYAPLTSNDGGVFNENFPFRLAIEGNSDKLDIVNYPTDKFITDFFQYVNYQKINSVLLDKIGWRSLAYIDAANKFATSLEGQKLFVTYYKNNISGNSSSINYDTVVTEALNSGVWSYYSDKELLLESVKEIISNDSTIDVSVTKNIISYFFSCDNSVLIDSTFRNELAEYLLQLDSSLLDYSLSFENGYSSILAEVLSTDSNNDVKDYVKGQIDSIVETLNPSEKSDLLIAYNKYLGTNGDGFFSNVDETSKYELLYTLFDSIDTSKKDIFYNTLYTLLTSDSKSYINSSTVADKIMQYEGFSSLTDEQVNTLFSNIISNNKETEMSTYIDSYGKESGIYEELGISSFDSIYNNINLSDSSAEGTSVINQRVDLYNQIRQTETFKTYLNNLIKSDVKFYDKATEANNTFQSNKAPVNEGSTTADIGFSYTKTVTPSTYFYGPYEDEYEHTLSSPGDTFINTSNYIKTSNFGNNGFYNMFMTTDKTISDSLYASGYITNPQELLYEYGTEGANNQFTLATKGLFKQSTNPTEDFNDVYYRSDFTGCQLSSTTITNLVDSSGETFSTDGAFISPIYFTSDPGEFGSNSTISGKYFIIDKNGKKHVISDGNAKNSSGQNINTVAQWYNIFATYGLKYYMAIPTTTYSSYMTGNSLNAYGSGVILYYDSGWFTHKISSRATKTSQYIRYASSNLLNLDGVYSTYGDKTTLCDDERTIINRLFNEYFLTSSNVSTFKNIVKKAMLEQLLTNNPTLIRQVINSNINSSITIGGNNVMQYLSYDGTSTVGTYLSGLYEVDNLSKLASVASQNKGVFVDVVNVLFNNSVSTGGNSSVDISGATPDNNFGSVMYGGVTYTSRFSFSSMEFIINPDDSALEFILSCDGGTRTINFIYKNDLGQILNLDGTINTSSSEITTSVSDQYKEISTVTIAIPTGASTLVVNPSAQDIYIYAIYAERLSQYTYDPTLTSTSPNAVKYTGYKYDITKTSTSMVSGGTPTIVNNAVSYASGATGWYTIPTKTEITNAIKASDSSAKNIEIISVNVQATVYNSYKSTRYYAVSTTAISNSQVIYPKQYFIYNNGTKVVTINKTSSITVNITDAINYLGSVITVLANNTSEPNTWGSSYINKGNIYFSKIVVSAIYTAESTKSTETFYCTVTGERYRSLLSLDSDVEELPEYNEFVNSMITFYTPLDAKDETIGTTTYKISDYQEKIFTNEFYNKLLHNSNSYLNNVIAKIPDVDVQKELLNLFIMNNSNFYDSFIDYHKDNSNFNTDDFKLTLVSTYLASNYDITYQNSLVTDTTLVSSKMYDLINQFSQTYRFISSDGSIDMEKFDNLCELIGYNTSNSGYGIFALSSSQGIQNGTFIPDNLALEEMDAMYTYDSVLGSYKLTADGTKTASWRVGKTEYDDQFENEANPDSVNYGFLTGMKQLKLAISTTIFNLDLIDNEGNNIYSSSNLIDLDNDSIVYYIPTDYSVNSFNINTQTKVIANNATLSNFSGFSSPSGSPLTSIGTVKVTAEDPTIQTVYTLNLVFVDVSYDITLTSSSEVAAKGGQLIANIVSPSATGSSTDKLPEGLDISNYIYIENESGNKYTNFNFATAAVVDENGNVSININVLESLSYGDYYLVVSLFNSESLTKKKAFTKIPSSESNITSFVFEGEELINSFVTNNNVKSYTSYIDFGRCYNYDELMNGAYLNQFTYSYGANVTTSVTYTTKINNDDIWIYTIIYTVTAEDGIHTTTYYHYLEEKTSFATPFISIFKNGTTDNSSVINTTTYEVTISFERNLAPEYKIKYNLTNFNTNGLYSYSFDSSLSGYLIAEASYSGLSATIADSADAGEYIVCYVYTNTGIWYNDTNGSFEYEKIYNFPSISINKLYSTDSLVSKLTFLDENKGLGDLYTVMYPDIAIRPNLTNNETTDEQIYGTLAAQQSAERKIYVNFQEGIDYKDSSTASNYYSIGSISKAELSNYAPTFAIDSYAEIYQYTTAVRYDSYGAGKQTQKDTNILNSSNSTVLYLYVLFDNDANNNTNLFFVKCSNGIWGDVFEIDSDFTDDSNAIATYNKDSNSFTYAGVTYTKNQFAGTTNTTYNIGLYMDYIGTPLEAHFWYVDYVVFSENYLNSPSSTNSYLRFYHLSLIDNTNTVYFDIEIKVPKSLEIEAIYTYISYNIYNGDTYNSTGYISGVASKEEDGTDYMIYRLNYTLQVLPRGYFYFYLSLPDGYGSTYENTNGKNNQNTLEAEKGAYLPPSSIVAQRVSLLFTIKKMENGTTWGQQTSSQYMRESIYQE